MAGLQEKLQGMDQEIENLAHAIGELRGNPAINRFVAAKQWRLVDCAIRHVRELRGHFGKIYAVQWASDSQHVVSASQDGTLMVWNAMTTMKVQAVTLRSAWVMSCAFAPSRSYVCCGGLDNICSVYRLDENNDGQPLKKAQAELSAHDGYISCCRFMATDNEVLTSSGDTTIKLWDLQQSPTTPKQTFVGHEADVMSIATNSNRTQFVSGSCDTLAKLWDPRAGSRCVQTFPGHESDINSVDFFGDDQAFGSGSDDSTCRLFDIRSLRQLNTYINEQCVCGITSIASSRTGHYLFAAYDDSLVRVWDTLSGKCKQVLQGHNNRVSCLGVPEDGKALVTGSWDQLLRIWANDHKQAHSSRMVNPREQH